MNGDWVAGFVDGHAQGVAQGLLAGQRYAELRAATLRHLEAGEEETAARLAEEALVVLASARGVEAREVAYSRAITFKLPLVDELAGRRTAG